MSTIAQQLGTTKFPFEIKDEKGNMGPSYMIAKNVDEVLPKVCTKLGYAPMNFLKLQVHDIPNIGLCYTVNDLEHVLPKDVLRELETLVISYNPEFLKTKMDDFINKITNTPELLNVFKRLKDK